MNKIKQIRKRLGISAYAIAKTTKLTASYISNLENGKRVNPSKETMEKISSALGKTVQEVFYPFKSKGGQVNVNTSQVC